MSTRLDLLCSASTAGPRAGAFPADGPLDPKGRAALVRLGGGFASRPRVLRSPAVCARETAEGLELAASPEPALRDCDFGRWAGRSLAEIEVEEPEALALWLRDPEAAPHGGESFGDVAQRVGRWMNALPASFGTVLAITHAAVLRAAIVHALAAPPRALLSIDVSPLSRARLARAHGVWRFSALIPVQLSR